MPTLSRGAFRLFRFAGVDVFLHWSWFLVAAYEISGRSKSYSSVGWNIAEYLALFLIVLLHEYGHALACRQVGGIAERIVLWPLGGVAYVNPPPRAGAMLWSIAAGPLVNLALVPVISGLGVLNRSLGGAAAMPNAQLLLRSVWYINMGLLIFNLLPIYPLDGGQILRSLLWFVVGRARSLMAATMIGFAGAAALIYFAVRMQSSWFVIISVFILMNCWSGLQQARALSRLAKLPRHAGFSCPTCKASPPVGGYWMCSQCEKPFDTFQTQAVCPSCDITFATTKCMDCGRTHAMSEWTAAALIPQHL